MKNIFFQFDYYINKNKLFDPNQHIMLAVSGGVDSMVMAYLFYKAGFKFSIAHCNFKLRGKQADKDEELVKQTAEKYNVPFFLKVFETEKYSRRKSISIQMAARELRYSWFEELFQKKLCDYIALAHHKNDLAETMLVNLCRGTGVAGLHGIKNKNNFYIRPLLFALRKDIELFAYNINVKYRDDVTNFEEKYTRNKIRLKIIPELESINPDIINTLYETASNISDAEIIYQDYINSKIKTIVTENNNVVEIDIAQLSKLKASRSVLFEIIKKYGFNASQVDDIIYSISNLSGKMFFSHTHRLLKDRQKLIIEQNIEPKKEFIFVEENQKKADTSFFSLEFTIIENTPDFTPFSKSNSVVYFDYNMLKFPLNIRLWEAGDNFVPFGMKWKKKVSDFLIDNKINQFDKEKCMVLTSGKLIAWIIGIRIDNRFKIKPQTKQILKIEILPLNK